MRISTRPCRWRFARRTNSCSTQGARVRQRAAFEHRCRLSGHAGRRRHEGHPFDDSKKLLTEPRKPTGIGAGGGRAWGLVLGGESSSRARSTGSHDVHWRLRRCPRLAAVGEAWQDAARAPTDERGCSCDADAEFPSRKRRSTTSSGRSSRSELTTVQLVEALSRAHQGLQRHLRRAARGNSGSHHDDRERRPDQRAADVESTPGDAHGMGLRRAQGAQHDR